MDLSFLCNVDELCSFYDDLGDDTFRVGYLVALSESFAVFNLVSTRGFENGLYFTSVDNIYQVSVNDKYTNRIKRLFKIQNQSKTELEFNGENPLFDEFLQYSQKNEQLITIETDNGTLISGKIKAFDCNVVNINAIDEDGIEDGEIYIETDCIVKMWCNTDRERNIQELYRAENI